MKEVFAPVDMIMVAAEKTKAAKHFQMSRHSRETLVKVLCQTRSSEKVIENSFFFYGGCEFF